MCNLRRILISPAHSSTHTAIASTTTFASSTLHHSHCNTPRSNVLCIFLLLQLHRNQEVILHLPTSLSPSTNCSLPARASLGGLSPSTNCSLPACASLGRARALSCTAGDSRKSKSRVRRRRRRRICDSFIVPITSYEQLWGIFKGVGGIEPASTAQCHAHLLIDFFFSSQLGSEFIGLLLLNHLRTPRMSVNPHRYV